MAMEVILQHDVDNLGHVGEVVRVKPGYARNYLLPRGLAVLADRKNLARLEHQKRAVASLKAKAEAEAQKTASRLGSLAVRVQARVGEEGRLFGSVTNLDIQRALAEQGFEVDRKKVMLDSPIKTLGTFDVRISLAAGVRGTVKVTVVGIEGEQTQAAPTESEEKSE